MGISVDNGLSHETIPQGVTSEDYESFHKQRDQTYPPTVFDFFAYGGINRPVKLMAMPELHLKNINVDSKIASKNGNLSFRAEYNKYNKST